jgi:carbonic anhydrase/acetyltransferase-like protein (isoleucine patch superfamily)
VYIGAILTIAGSSSGSGSSSQFSSRPNSLLLGRPVATWDLLGKSLLDRVIERLHIFGVDRVSAIFEDSSYRSDQRYRREQTNQRGSSFWKTWDAVVSEYLDHGMETLVLIRLGPYAEFDLSDVLRAHHHTGSDLVQVFRGESPLDFVVVRASRLRHGEGSYRNRLSNLLHHRHVYSMEGYFNPLSSPHDFRRLLSDGLLGRCSIRPVGREIEPGIWLGEGASVDASATVEPPVYVGAHSSLGPACKMLGLSSVEKQCEIDAGTTVQHSSVLEGTYLGMGLHLQNTVAGNNKLFHLERDIEIEIQDSRLIGKPGLHHNVSRAARSFMSSVLSTHAAQAASVNRQAGEKRPER